MMKKATLVLVLLALSTSLHAQVLAAPKLGTSDGLNIELTFNGYNVKARLLDSATARDFLSLLPLTLEFKDYAGTETIAYPPRKLSAKGAQAGADPSPGDIAYYAPWGNLAIYYRDFEYSSGLILLGKIDGGVEALRGFSGSIRISVAD